jgi:hypothetical protein
MDPLLRNFILLAGLVFCLIFGAMTAAVAAQGGIDVLVVVSFLIILMVMLGILGALRNPPRR